MKYFVIGLRSNYKMTGVRIYTRPDAVGLVIWLQHHVNNCVHEQVDKYCKTIKMVFILKCY